MLCLGTKVETSQCRSDLSKMQGQPMDQAKLAHVRYERRQILKPLQGERERERDLVGC